MTAKTRFLLLNIFGLSWCLAFFLTCRQDISFDFNGTLFTWSAGLIVLCSYVVGAMIGVTSLLPFMKGRQEENVAKLKEWQEQDAKLAIEVQSDKEKQLEAKIATLEAALKQALKK